MRDSKTFIDPLYLKGDFYEKSAGGLDAAYKVNQLRQLLVRNQTIFATGNWHIADVGCGTGETTIQLHTMMNDLYGIEASVEGYDIHPYIKTREISDSIRYINGDFCQIADGIYDLVVLFDVIEHIPDPITFLKVVSGHARLLALHIPLDDSFLSWVRNLPREGLFHPGHILVFDLPAVINLLAYSGLRIQDYAFSPSFQAPSCKKSLSQKLLYPFRSVMYILSPYLRACKRITPHFNNLSQVHANCGRMV